MRLRNLLQPHYLFRPSQVVRRMARAWRPAAAIENVMVPWGVELQVDTRETIGHWIHWFGLWDATVCETLWRLLRPGDVAVDAGANIGCMTTLMAMRVGPAGRVVAFEPHPVIHERLALNVARAQRRPGASAVELRAEALSAAVGTARLAAGNAEFAVNHGIARIVGADAAADGVVFTVPTTRLDEVVRDARVRVLKADVEGHEAALFAGASELLERGAIDHVVYEDQRGGASPVHDLLGARGYRVFALGSRLLGPVLGERHASLTRPGETPDYVATREPEELQRLMAPRGWRVFAAARRP